MFLVKFFWAPIFLIIVCFGACSSAVADQFSTNVTNDVYGIAQGGTANGIPTANDNNDGIPDIYDAINLIQGSSLAHNKDADPLFVEADEVWKELNGTILLIGLTAGYRNTIGVYTDIGTGAVKKPLLGPFSGFGFTGDGSAANPFPAAATALGTGTPFGLFLSANQQIDYFSEVALNPSQLDHMMTFDLPFAKGKTIYINSGSGPTAVVLNDPFLIAWEDLPYDGNTLGDDDYDDMMYIVDKVGNEYQKIDFSISNIKIAQTVFEPDRDGDSRIDLVNNRNAAILVTVHISGQIDVQQLKIIARLGEEVVASKIFSLDTNGGPDQEFPLVFIPKIPRDYILIAVVDSDEEIDEENENNNTSQPKDISIISTKQLIIPYVRIEPPLCFGGPCYGYLQETALHIKNSNDFMQATYPIAVSGFLGPEVGLAVTGSYHYVWKLEYGGKGFVEDMNKVFKAAKKEFPNAKRAVGIVSKNYFLYHNLCFCTDKDGNKICAKGVRIPGQLGVLVTEGHWNAMAHEIGHSFGLPVGFIGGEAYNFNKETCTSTNPPENQVNGYWVEENQEIKGVFDFMGTSPYHPSINPPDRWVSKRHWETLFKKLDSQSSDPELLLISGLYYTDRTIEIEPWYTISSGIPDNPEPGPFNVQLFDNKGNILIDIPFNMTFMIEVEPFGLTQTDVTGFAFAIPYPQTADTLKIVLDGQVLASVTPTTKLLDDAIDAIPDFGFKNNPKQRRNALHSVVSAISKMLQVNAYRGAEQALLNGFVSMIKFWLVDGYIKTEALQLEKIEVIELSEAIAQRIRSDITGQGGQVQRLLDNVPDNLLAMFVPRGDANLDGDLDVSDPITILQFIFLGKDLKYDYLADANNDLQIDITDPIELLGFLFCFNKTSQINETMFCPK